MGAIRVMLLQNEIAEIRWIEKDKQLADPLTKKGAPMEKLLQALVTLTYSDEHTHCIYVKDCTYVNRRDKLMKGISDLQQSSQMMIQKRMRGDCSLSFR